MKHIAKQPHFTLRMVAEYFLLTFAFTWAIIIPTLSSVPEGSQLPFFILAVFGPFLAASIVISINFGRSLLLQWLRQIFAIRIPLILYLAGAFILPIGIGALHYGLYWALGGSLILIPALPWFAYPIDLLGNLLTGGNEEPGWRGFALPALLERFHPLLASLILGLIHAAWHLPLMSYYGTTFGWYLFEVIPLTFILNWFYLKSHQSVIPVMFLHAGTNMIYHFIPAPAQVLLGFAAFIPIRGVVYWGMAIVILVGTKGRLGFARAQ
ncbi:CPBP family intramembrane metalloprotease [Candidatus Bathyarchaeota archaeon]|nr:MAG: CPBP family intramembrane metalloprotease [Candidatus Bathyarchaeota archaeon]